MMRNIAIGLAAATIAISSTLSVSALYGQESGISKGSMSRSVKSHRFGARTYGFYDEERGRGNRFAERLMTVAHTARKQRKDVLAFLTACCQAQLDGTCAPSLFAAA